MAMFKQGSGSAALLMLVVGSLLAVSTMAATFRISWDLSTNYASKYGSTPFASGDILIFTFGPSHSLQEVSTADATACNAGNPIKSYNSGDQITLTKDTNFICGTPGHCQQGMVINIKLTSSTPTTPTTPSTPTTPTSPGTTPTSPGTTPNTPTTPTENLPPSGASGIFVSAAGIFVALICPLLL